jgi:hypothetical protein
VALGGTELGPDRKLRERNEISVISSGMELDLVRTSGNAEKGAKDGWNRLPNTAVVLVRLHHISAVAGLVRHQPTPPFILRKHSQVDIVFLLYSINQSIRIL